MKKIVTLGATTLTALTLLGAAQPLAHASQIHVTSNQAHTKLISLQNKDDADIIDIPDAGFKKLLNNKIDASRPDTQDITAGELSTLSTTLKTLDIRNNKDIKNIEGVQYLTSLTLFSAAGVKIGDSFDKLATLKTIGIANCGNCDITSLKGFENNDTIRDIQLQNNHISDLTPLAKIAQVGFTGSTSFKSQTLDNDAVTASDGSVSTPIKDIKNIDGTSPTITVQNGGKIDGSNVVWDRLPGSTSSVTYTWNSTTSNKVFSGTVTVPVTWASDEDKAQADVNLLFKDNTRNELDTGVTVQKIETVRKEVNALTDSAQKTNLLNQIGDAYGMYFIGDAKSTQAGDPLGDKVKADSNMKNLHDFVEAATDYEADMTKGKTSNASAGIYDHVRSGWSKAIITAQSRVNSYVAGTDWSQAGLGEFSKDVANLNTAAAAIQADQNDINNDKVEVQYHYTVQAPGEPGWYGIVPSAITLTDANRNAGQLANVELKDATKVGGKYVPYDGGKTVEVSVKSDNSYKLDDHKNDPMVDYKLDFVDGSGTHDVVQDNSEHKIGEMKAGSATIVSHVSLVGNATASGTYTDNLFYHFSEK